MKQRTFERFFRITNKLKQITMQQVIPILFLHRSYGSAYESELNIQPRVQLVINIIDLQWGKDFSKEFPAIEHTGPDLFFILD